MTMQTIANARPSLDVVTPPFRADHVGSLLRSPELKAAREKLLGPHTAEANIGPHGNETLRILEDQHVRDAIGMQKRVGLNLATDGELRRRSWMLELFLGWEGIGATRSGGGPIKWRNETGASQDMTEFRINQPIRWAPSSIVRAFEFLKAETDLIPKVGLPSPCPRPSKQETFPFSDVLPLVRELVDRAPNRLLWGSDWPHPQYWRPMPSDSDLLDMMLDWVPDEATRNLIFVDNPIEAFGFSKVES